MRRSILAAAAAALLTALAAQAPFAGSSTKAAAMDDGVVKVRSAYSADETIARIKQDIAAKGILFFLEVDQAKLAKDAGITLRRSTLLVFGNPPLGTLFITAKPNAGLDWPVRLLVTEDETGAIWAVYTDFAWIARRHGIENRPTEFKMAAEVVRSITSSISK